MNQPPPISKAAALKYQGGSRGAPRLAAKGQGWLAEQIKTLARTHNVPLYQDPDLIQVLEKLEYDQEIPLEIFAVVAEIFAYLYRTGQATRKTVTE